jgi:calcineurin-like phosphoesterase
MKAFLLVLLVCVAGTYAESGPFKGLLDGLQQTVQTALNQLISSLLSLLPHSKLDLQSLLSLLNADQLIQNFIDKIKDTLASLVAQVLGGSSKSALVLKAETQTRILDELSALGSQLQNLLLNIIGSLGGAIGKRDLTGLINLVTPLVDQFVSTLSPQLQSIVNSVLSSLFSGKRNSILDFILNAFNLGSVWSTIQGLGSSVVNQFLAVGSQLLFAGQQVWNQAQPIFNQLVSDLTNHVGDAVTIVAQAIAGLNQVIGSGKRDLIGSIVTSLGLDGVWATIQALGSSVYLQFVQIGTQLLFAGQGIWAQAQVVLNQLKDDLLNHTGDAITIVAQAIAGLNQILGSGKRDLISSIVTSLGLDGVWATIQALGSGVYLQFVQIGTQLLFAGQAIWAQAQVVLNQLKDDLLNHTGDAITIVAQAIASLNQVLGSGKRDLIGSIVTSLGLDAVWATIQALGSSVYLQFVQIGTQLLFAGQGIWAQAQVVLNQLKDDLLNHTGDAVTIVAQAIASLNQVLG